MSSKSQIKLQDGRLVDIRDLTQTLTYEGMLEGLPSPELNARYLERLVDDVASNYKGHGRPYLIPPKTRSTRGLPGSSEKSIRLPAITCVARLRSNAGVREGEYSELIVIWLQDTFVFPIAKSIAPSLTHLDWTALATDFGH